MSSNLDLGAGGVAAHVANSFTAAQRGAIIALADAATITPDFSLGNNFGLTIGGARTLANPTNLVPGQSGVIKVQQDSAGSRSLAFGSYYKFPNGSIPSLSSGANAVDEIVYYVESATFISCQFRSDVK